VKVRYQVAGGCWRFFGAHDTNGYGRISYRGRQYQVQRVIYRVLVGEIPPKREIKTVCGTRDCVKVDHLYFRGDQRLSYE